MITADLPKWLPLVCLDKVVPVKDRPANAQSALGITWPGPLLFTPKHPMSFPAFMGKIISIYQLFAAPAKLVNQVQAGWAAVLGGWKQGL